MRAKAQCSNEECGSLYESSEIKHTRHGQNAWLKATTHARLHAERTSHPVFVDMGDSHGIVQCLCGTCRKVTPGKATGICDECLFARLQEM